MESTVSVLRRATRRNAVIHERVLGLRENSPPVDDSPDTQPISNGNPLIDIQNRARPDVNRLSRMQRRQLVGKITSHGCAASFVFDTTISIANRYGEECTPDVSRRFTPLLVKQEGVVDAIDAGDTGYALEVAHHFVDHAFDQLVQLIPQHDTRAPQVVDHCAGRGLKLGRNSPNRHVLDPDAKNRAPCSFKRLVAPSSFLDAPRRRTSMRSLCAGLLGVGLPGCLREH
ncbi:hypothetical protein [Paraburkholderia sp.]|uniref:hypothetical protein n=1 Tax=Paraburkholderia sp. TaxID=1926495 RepID=UPI003C7D9ED1